MRDFITALAIVGAAAAWRFVIVFWWRTRGDWARNPGGRHVMQLTAYLGVLLTLSVITRIWPNYPGRAPIVGTFFALVVMQLVWRNVLMDREQDAHDRETERRR